MVRARGHIFRNGNRSQPAEARAKQRINPRDLREIARVTKQSSLDHEILLVPRSRPERRGGGERGGREAG